jgi:tetratricopeptide (TPR) repeat protein
MSNDRHRTRIRLPSLRQRPVSINGGKIRAVSTRERYRSRSGRIDVGLIMMLSCAGLCASSGSAQDLRSGLAAIQALDDAGRLDQAVPQYRDLLRQHPDSTLIRLGLANDLAQTGKCEDFPESDSSSAGSAGAAREVVIGICHFRRNEIAAALTHLTGALRLDSHDKLAAIFLARAYAESGKPGESVRVLASLGQAARDDRDVLYWTGVFYDQLAEAAYDTMAKSYPDSYPVLETQGDQLVQQQKYDEALKAYQKAQSVAPNAPGLHFDLGNAYWHMARFDEAAAELSAALKANPNDSQVNYELGDIAVKQGDADRGLTLLKKALALDPSLVEAHRSLGRAYLAKRDFPASLRELLIVAEAEPSDHTIHALLASVYQRAGRRQEAEEETRKYNELVKQQMSDLHEKESEQNRDAQSGESTPQK